MTDNILGCSWEAESPDIFMELFVPGNPGIDEKKNPESRDKKKSGYTGTLNLLNFLLILL